MKALRSFILALAAVVVGSVPAFAQTTLNSTTTTAAVTATQQIIPLTSVTSISAGSRNVAGDLLWIDAEAMQVNALDTVALTATVTRGVRGTGARAHVSGVVVWTGPARRFYQNDVLGSCTAANEEFLPHINTSNGNAYQCSSSEWVKMRDNGYRVAWQGRSDGGTTYTASGAITIQPGISFINGSTLAMTLANPTTEQNGLVMYIVSTNASAHTLTYTAGFGGGTTSRDVGTFGGAVNDAIAIIAVNGVWWTLWTRNVTIA